MTTITPWTHGEASHHDGSRRRRRRIGACQECRDCEEHDFVVSPRRRGCVEGQSCEAQPLRRQIPRADEALRLPVRERRRNYALSFKCITLAFVLLIVSSYTVSATSNLYAPLQNTYQNVEHAMELTPQQLTKMAHLAGRHVRKALPGTFPGGSGGVPVPGWNFNVHLGGQKKEAEQEEQAVEQKTWLGRHERHQQRKKTERLRAAKGPGKAQPQSNNDVEYPQLTRQQLQELHVQQQQQEYQLQQQQQQEYALQQQLQLQQQQEYQLQQEQLQLQHQQAQQQQALQYQPLQAHHHPEVQRFVPLAQGGWVQQQPAQGRPMMAAQPSMVFQMQQEQSPIYLRGGHRPPHHFLSEEFNGMTLVLVPKGAVLPPGTVVLDDFPEEVNTAPLLSLADSASMTAGEGALGTGPGQPPPAPLTQLGGGVTNAASLLGPHGQVPHLIVQPPNVVPPGGSGGLHPPHPHLPSLDSSSSSSSSSDESGSLSAFIDSNTTATSDANSNTNTSTNANSNTNLNANTNSNSNANTNSNSNANTNTNSNANTNTNFLNDSSSLNTTHVNRTWTKIKNHSKPHFIEFDLNEEWNASPQSEIQGRDQLLILTTVASMALLVGAISARKLRSRQAAHSGHGGGSGFWSACMEGDVEEDMAYDAATTTTSQVGAGNMYGTIMGGGSPGGRTAVSTSTAGFGPGAGMMGMHGTTTMGYDAFSHVSNGWRGDLEKFDV